MATGTLPDPNKPPKRSVSAPAKPTKPAPKKFAPKPAKK